MAQQSERKKAKIKFSDRHALNFWKDAPTSQTPDSTYSLEFPSERRRREFEEDMIASRHEIDVTLRKLRWEVALDYIGGDIRQPKQGYTKKQAEKDVITKQMKFWEKCVKRTAAKHGVVFKKL